MKTGKTITELAREIERQAAAKVDFITPTDKLEMGVVKDAGATELRLHSPVGDFGINSIAHGQIAQNLQIPKPYYDRMLLEEPELLAKNVNTWFHKNPEKRMVRTLFKQQRAFLSDRFRPLENSDLAEAALPVLADLGVDVVSSEITERRMYIKVVDKKIHKDIPTGARLGEGHVRFDTLSPALVLSNSEVGMGSLSCETAIWTGGCTNLAVINSRSLRKYHVGKKLELGDEIYALLSDETRRVTDQAVWMQVRDVVKAAFDEARFLAQTDELGRLVEIKLDANPVEIVNLASKRLGVNDNEQGNILRHLINGGDLTAYGLFNAITRTAEDLPDYDRATEFERMGGKLIDLTANDWQEMKQAA